MRWQGSACMGTIYQYDTARREFSTERLCLKTIDYTDTVSHVSVNTVE